VFQGGPRTCLGKEMAFVQMKFVASSVLRRFELVPVDEGRVPAFVPLMTAHMAGGLNVTVRTRKDRPMVGSSSTKGHHQKNEAALLDQHPLVVRTGTTAATTTGLIS
jgi:hypothetical protein